MKKLPNFLKDKSKKAHQFYLFGDDLFLNTLPCVLYKFGDELVCNTDDFERKIVHVFSGDSINDSAIFYLDPTDGLWCELNNFSKSITVFKEEIEQLKETYGDCFEVEYYNQNGWICFDLQKWISQTISPEIVIDLSRGEAFTVSNLNKRISIPELKNWTDPQWQGLYNGIVCHSIALLERTLEKVEKELKSVKLDSNLLEIYTSVANGDMSYTEFVKIISE